MGVQIAAEMKEPHHLGRCSGVLPNPILCPQLTIARFGSDMSPVCTGGTNGDQTAGRVGGGSIVVYNIEGISCVTTHTDHTPRLSRPAS